MESIAARGLSILLLLLVQTQAQHGLVGIERKRALHQNPIAVPVSGGFFGKRELGKPPGPEDPDQRKLLQNEPPGFSEGNKPTLEKLGF